MLWRLYINLHIIFSFFSVIYFLKRISEFNYYGDYMTVYVQNVITPNMNSEVELVQIPTPITWEELDQVLQDGNYINSMGHDDIAKMVGLTKNRISISLQDGDVVYIAQYIGPRLKEGQTTLPKGAKIIPIRYDIVHKRRISISSL